MSTNIFRSGWSKWQLALWAALLISSAAILDRFYFRHASLSKAHAASGVPYTVTRSEKGFDSKGNLKYTNRYTESKRSDGTYMWSFVSSVAQQRRINYPNGDQVLTNELLFKKSTMPHKLSSSLVQRDPDLSCITADDSKAGWLLDGTEPVGNFRTARLKRVTQKRTMLAWHALDAGCALVQMHFEHEEGVTEQTLVSLTTAEPDQTLFQLSSAFQEVAPSGLYTPVCVNGKCSSVPAEVLQKLDKKYSQLNTKL